MQTLPHRDQDTVLTLYAHYFLASVLMRKNFDRLDSKRIKRGTLSQSDTVDGRIYFFSWLGFLYVTCEGFRKLSVRRLLQSRPPDFLDLVPQADNLGKQIEANADSLRKVRNAVFHLREDTVHIEAFFERSANRVAWARELQLSLADFFSSYRVCCEVHYYLSDRIAESQSSPKRQGPIV